MVEGLWKAIVAIDDFLASTEFLLVVGALIVTWILARTSVALVHRPWQSGIWRVFPPAACGLVVLVVWVIWAGLSEGAEWQTGKVSFWWTFWPPLVASVACAAAALSVGLTIGGRALRARQIVEQSAPGARPRFEERGRPLGPRPAPGTGRRIVIFCDGTSNHPDQLDGGVPAPTNVCRLYQDLAKDESQVGWYDAGVATETSSQAMVGATTRRLSATFGAFQIAKIAGWYIKFRTLVEAAFGVGITENIVQAYSEIARQYRPGDRIYLIGFSRGAYTARCVAGVIRRCGLLRAENIRYAADVVRLYRTRESAENDVPIRESLRHKDLPAVEFLGLFDTVASLGVPMWGWWFNARWFFRNLALSTDPAPICIHVYHAMAMDERRAQFFPTPFDKPIEGAWTQTLNQVWFRGAHSDIGGGYADVGLSDLALAWMLDACLRHGLVFKGQLGASLRPEPLARLHDQLTRQPGWRLLGSWPRWHPVDAELHPSVVTRATAIHNLGRHDLEKVGAQPLYFRAEAQREWDRTGLIIEGNGALYRLTWLGGEWRDGDRRPCGARGQSADGLWRRLWRHRRRLPRQPYMRLCLLVAHPRAWPLRELGLPRLLSYLFVRDPKELREQVAPVGRDLESPGASVQIMNKGRAGLLYVFANDLWLTAANNSGALDLKIELLTGGAPAVGPLWTLLPDGRWVRTEVP